MNNPDKREEEWQSNNKQLLLLGTVSFVLMSTALLVAHRMEKNNPKQNQNQGEKEVDTRSREQKALDFMQEQYADMVDVVNQIEQLKVPNRHKVVERYSSTIKTINAWKKEFKGVLELRPGFSALLDDLIARMQKYIDQANDANPQKKNEKKKKDKGSIPPGAMIAYRNPSPAQMHRVQQPRRSI